MLAAPWVVQPPLRALRTPHSRWRRAYSALARPALKVAIIGSGPSGFYTASRILNQLPADTPEGAAVRVDMYERLPTPYGLVRYGVAPDHPEVKNCQHKFDELESDGRFSFLGNVSVGTTPHSTTPNPNAKHLPHYTYPHALHIPLSQLLPYYNAVIFTYGASLSNPLSSTPGSAASASPIRGVIPALALVGWYNGHPAYADLDVDLSKVQNVDVVGQGNVALDVARMLLSPIDHLAKTDMPDSVLSVLTKSAVKRVRAVGRRGPAQVAFTTKELREQVKLAGVNFPGVEGPLMEQAKELAKGDRARTRMLGLMDKPAYNENASRTFELEFLKSPREFIAGEDGSVAKVTWDLNELVLTPAKDGGKPIASAKRTGQTVTEDVDMVVESVGYRSEPIGALANGTNESDGTSTDYNLPFDQRQGCVLNDRGRVLLPSSTSTIPGMYAAGWAAHGPVGVIASTMQAAYGLVDDVLLRDYFSPEWSARGDQPKESVVLNERAEEGRPDAIERGLKEGNVVNLAAWNKIDAAEKEIAKKAGTGKEREKFVRVEDMLSVL